MAEVLEVVNIIVHIVAKPIALVSRTCVLVIRSISIIVNTWAELLTAALCFHVNIFWRLLIWVIALLSLPMRAFTALRRERLLEMHMHEMQTELENLAWEKDLLQERIQTETKELKLIEMILTEMENEHDMAITKIEQLESEVLNLKVENQRLREVQDKALWSYRGLANASSTGNALVVDNHAMDSWKSSDNGSGRTSKQMMQKDAWEDQTNRKGKDLGSEKVEPGDSCPNTSAILSRDFDVKDLMYKTREIAVSRSLFSAVLSLLVGVIIWEAKDPCMPLVIALFTVVGMSMRSVIQFFFTIKNKPASDVVALLSLNCFILGTLAYPALPKLAHMLAPLTSSLLERLTRLLGF